MRHALRLLQDYDIDRSGIMDVRHTYCSALFISYISPKSYLSS